jgi:hypothetical protein
MVPQQWALNHFKTHDFNPLAAIVNTIIGIGGAARGAENQSTRAPSRG